MPKLAWLQLAEQSIIDGFVRGHASAGPIPTEIGQLVQLKMLNLDSNELTGARYTNLLGCNW